MSAPDPPPPPQGGHGGGPAGKDSLQPASGSASETQPVIDVFGSDMAPAVFTLALLMLNLLSGMSSSRPRKVSMRVLWFACGVNLRFLTASESCLAKD